MAGVGFDYQPHLAAGFELQGIASGEGEVDFDLYAAIDAGGNNHVASLQRDEPSGNYVSGAKAFGL